MAICRFDDECDVYVFEDVQGGFTCCGCILMDRDGVNLPTASEMIAHLKKHEGAGHRVPLSAFDELQQISESGSS